MIRSFFLLFSALSLTSCASAVDGSFQEVTLLTPGTDQAECFFRNKGLNKKVLSNETITLIKTKDDLTVECLAPGNRQKTVVVPSMIEPSTIVNITNGIIPGVSYDYFSRALFAYPEVITVSFADVPVQGYDYPAYQSTEYPDLNVIEYMGPDVPMNEDDKYDIKPVLQKKDRDLQESNPFRSASSETSMTPVLQTGLSASSPSGTTADELTRSMNPHVFDK